MQPQQTIDPVADAYVRDSSYANTNFGTTTTMVVKADAAGYVRNSYFKFDYNSFTQSTVSSAVLRLYVSSVNTAASRVISVYGITDTSWTETAITWNNKPTAGVLLGTITVSNQVNLWYEFDVTSYIQSNMNGKKVSFRLVNEGTPGSATDVLFNTKEAASNKPQLILRETYAGRKAPVAVNDARINTADSPAKVTVHINIPDANAVIRIFDINGKMLKQVTAARTTVDVDIRDLSAGLYFINYYVDNKMMGTEKLLIQ